MDLMKLVLLVKVQLTHPTTYYHLLLRTLQIRTKVSLQLLMNLQEVLIKSRLGVAPAALRPLAPRALPVQKKLTTGYYSLNVSSQLSARKSDQKGLVWM